MCVRHSYKSFTCVVIFNPHNKFRSRLYCFSHYFTVKEIETKCFIICSKSHSHWQSWDLSPASLTPGSEDDPDFTGGRDVLLLSLGARPDTDTGHYCPRSATSGGCQAARRPCDVPTELSPPCTLSVGTGTCKLLLGSQAVSTEPGHLIGKQFNLQGKSQID